MWLIKNWNGKCSLDAYSQAWMNNRETWNQISRLTASDIKVPPTILPLSFSQFWNCFSLLWAWRMLHQICKVPAATKVWIKLLHMVRNTNRAPVRSIGLFERPQKILSRTQTHLKLLVYIRDETRCLALDQVHTEQALALQRWRNTRLFRDQISQRYILQWQILLFQCILLGHGGMCDIVRDIYSAFNSACPCREGLIKQKEEIVNLITQEMRKNSLPQVIPTMTFQDIYLDIYSYTFHTIVSEILSGI